MNKKKNRSFLITGARGHVVRSARRGYSQERSESLRAFSASSSS